MNLLRFAEYNGNYEASFILGSVYHQGIEDKRDIQKVIEYYKKASFFNNQFTKNNLGNIYKNLKENKYDYTFYFDEAIRQKMIQFLCTIYNMHTYI